MTKRTLFYQVLFTFLAMSICAVPALAQATVVESPEATLKDVDTFRILIEGPTPEVTAAGITEEAIREKVELKLRLAGIRISDSMGYPFHSGNPNILWLGSRGLGVPVGDDRSIRRWVHGDCLLHKAVEEFSPAA